MMSAAEPIRSKTIDEMLEAFKISKLRPETISPSYGLAEHTVAVALNGKKRFWVDRTLINTIGTRVKLTSPHSPSSLEIFGCGSPCQGVELRIVDPEKKMSLPNEHIGEIWVDSPSKALGYFQNPEETAEKFEAKLEGSPRSWLRTGDLGVLIEGELLFLGRIDDQILYRGKNIFPQDVEGTISEKIPEVRAGRVLSFGLPNTDEVFALIELKNEQPSEKDFDEVVFQARALLLQ
jgi:acyl-CoA synthetase (AMP-forming)/AMP-acid ligase II